VSTFTDLVSDYVWAVLRHWWFLVPGGVLAALQVAKIGFGWKWLVLSRKLLIPLAVGGFITAQFLAYEELWRSHYWLKPEVSQQLVKLSQNGEAILQVSLKRCRERRGRRSPLFQPPELEGFETQVADWESEVTSYLTTIGAGEKNIALFKSNTGFYISGWIITDCGDVGLALLLSRLEKKIEHVKDIWSRDK
jgi:hypothetical protein